MFIFKCKVLKVVYDISFIVVIKNIVVYSKFVNIFVIFYFKIVNKNIYLVCGVIIY